MGITLMFMVLATVAPFLFIRLEKKILAVVQSVMLVGMWVYFFEAVFHTAPHAFSTIWIMFYASMIIAEVAWIMFFGRIKKEFDTAKTGTSTY